MSDQTRQQLQQALELIKSGQRDQARTLLESIVKADPNNADAWWMMATAVATPVDMQNALQNVVRIRPDYPNAQQMLNQINAQLGVTGGTQSVPASTPPPAPVVPPQQQMPTQISVAAPTPPPAPNTEPLVPPTVSLTVPTIVPPTITTNTTTSSGSQIGESLDDLFAPLPTASTPPTASGSTFGSNFGTTDAVFTPAGYTPPPASQVKKGRNPLLYVLIGLVLAVVCVCGGCLVITLGSGAAVLGNPTFQAAIGTGIAMIDAPDKLPSSAKNKGTISANQPQSSQLNIFEQHVWKYQGQSSEQITITLTTTSTSSFVAYIGVYDASGSLIAKTQAGGTSPAGTKTLTTTLPGDGTFSILVGGIGGKVANYTLLVKSANSQ